MKKTLFYLLLLISLKGISQTPLYGYKINAASGTEIDFANFQGKKILIVNTASGSDKNSQIQQLNNLCSLYPKNLVVIVFPSNDFGNEPKSDSELVNLYSGIPSNFLIASKGAVTGINASLIYQWIAQANLNGSVSSAVTADFQKVLINGAGKIVSFFSGRIIPIEAAVTNAINTH